MLPFYPGHAPPRGNDCHAPRMLPPGPSGDVTNALITPRASGLFNFLKFMDFRKTREILGFPWILVVFDENLIISRESSSVLTLHLRATPRERAQDAPGVRGSRFRAWLHAPDSMHTFAITFGDFQIS